jgi:hypothetical protein
MNKRLKRLRKRPQAPEKNYDVGYCKPPNHSRFKEGNPGNPGKRAKKPDNILYLAEERVKSIILQEAYRVLKLHDGKQPVKIAVIKAAVRQLGLAAAKGQIRATTKFLELIMAIEAENRAAYADFVKTAIGYKAYWTAELERRKCVGSKEPDPIPHPDDIVINERTGAVEIHGPMTPKQKRLWDQAPRFLKSVDEELAELEKREKIDPGSQDFETERKHLLRLRESISRKVRRRRS